MAPSRNDFFSDAEQLVERPRREAGQIQRDEGETQLAAEFQDGAANLGLDGAGQSVGFELQARALAVPARAHLAETEGAHPVFKPIDLVQALGRDLGAVGKARRKAGRSEERRVGKECKSRWAP